MSGAHREAIQKQIHQDWANREYIEVITASIKRITDFLNSFGKKTVLLTSSYVVMCVFVHINTYNKNKINKRLLTNLPLSLALFTYL